MKTIFSLFLFCLLSQLSAAKAPEPALNALEAYIQAPDATTSWELVKKASIGESDVWLLKLQSQTWHGIPWTHDLILIRPKNAPPTQKMLLLNNGGTIDPSKMEEITQGVTLAQRINCPVAVLLGIPKQPLFGGLREDDLIAETFVRYLDSGDATWPLLFPMVKSVVKAMDSIEAITKAEWDQPIKKFIVTGASKRGWTTWLTAAADPRVSAIAPMVIDILNLPKQLPRQIELFGKPSEQIGSYTKRGLIPFVDSERGKKLWAMVDPFTYLEKYTMPKLIVLGNNDRYWATDALNLYWDEIPEPKYISYSPNAGHNLMELDSEGKKTNPMRAIDNVSAFVRLQLEDKLPPVITWTHSNTPEGELKLDVKTDTTPREARLWYTTSKTLDFRNAFWKSSPIEVTPEGEIHLTHPAPTSENYAYYVDLAYPVGDLTLWLCTQLRVVSPSR